MRYLTIVLVLIITGCANPINRVTSDNYTEECARAEARGNLEAAEEACYRALANVDWGNLGEELKSERLYNLARIKRGLAKFDEAEQLLIQSLKIEEKLSGPSSIKIGRRLAELSVNLAAQDRWLEGVPYVERLMGVTDEFSGYARNFTKEILQKYSEYLTETGSNEKAALFAAKAGEL
jgi:hypothetical protein